MALVLPEKRSRGKKKVSSGEGSRRDKKQRGQGHIHGNENKEKKC